MSALDLQDIYEIARKQDPELDQILTIMAALECRIRPYGCSTHDAAKSLWTLTTPIQSGPHAIKAVEYCEEVEHLVETFKIYGWQPPIPETLSFETTQGNWLITTAKTIHRNPLPQSAWKENQ